jgi:hypothetical protein
MKKLIQVIAVTFVAYGIQGSLFADDCSEAKIKDLVVQDLTKVKEMPPHNLKVGLKFEGDTYLATYSYDFVQIMGRGEKPVGIIMSMAGYSRYDIKSCTRTDGDGVLTYSTK